MSASRPLLMIPGPIEVSPAVVEACGGPPPGHLAPALIESFGSCLELMRRVWMAGASSQPFLVPAAGTLAMEMAAANVVSPGDGALVVNTGYFSDRMAEILRRLGAVVVEIGAPVGDAPDPAEVEAALERGSSREPAVRCLFATHVDTSTGVRIDPDPLARIARRHGALSVFDGVCATAAERFEMEAWGADVYLTASQKAIGLPPGLALLVASERAMATRRERPGPPPPLYLDWMEWLPVMRAYEERRPAYFATPATGLIGPLEVSLREILAEGIEARFALHERAARAMRAAWGAMGLTEVPVRGAIAANTLSALRFPRGVDASLVGRIAGHGVVVAGGLHPAIRAEYFRVGHMGYATSRSDMLLRTVRAVENALIDAGVPLERGAGERAAVPVLEDGSR